MITSTEHRQDLLVTIKTPKTCSACLSDYPIETTIEHDSSQVEALAGAIITERRATLRRQGWLGDLCPLCALAKGLNAQAGEPMTAIQRHELRGRLAQRMAKVHLESIRLFRAYRESGSDQDLERYVKALRRCQRLQNADRRLAA